VVAVGENEASTKLRVALELTVGDGKFVQHAVVGRVAFVGPVETHKQHVPTALDSNTGSFSVIAHAKSL
jgi:hypothetical protein